jgi:hypothetical protein
MLSIIWAPTADADLEEITNYIWQPNLSRSLMNVLWMLCLKVQRNGFPR